MSIQGKIKWFNGTKGFGFIARDDKENDVFIHISALRKSGLTRLDEGQAVTFEVAEGPKGLNAINVKKVG